jgi:hypothetical protein
LKNPTRNDLENAIPHLAFEFLISDFTEALPPELQERLRAAMNVYAVRDADL